LLLVHQLDPVLGLKNPGGDSMYFGIGSRGSAFSRSLSKRYRECFDDGFLSGTPAPAPGRCDLVEGRVRDVLADHVPQRDLRPTVHLHVLDEAFVLPGQVLGERVRRLVHVVVGVEHWIVENVGQ
jgi:hypothetical protein